MRIVYYSKLDFWLLLLTCVCAASAVILALQLSEWGSVTFFRISTAVTLLTLGLPLWLIFSTRYVLGDHHMAIICGPFKWRVPYAAIEDIKDSNSLKTSPALSLERLEIHYGQEHSVLISPRYKQSFTRDLRALVAHAKRTAPQSCNSQTPQADLNQL